MRKTSIMKDNKNQNRNNQQKNEWRHNKRPNRANPFRDPFSVDSKLTIEKLLQLESKENNRQQKDVRMI
jgi:hypothetical protein